MTSTPGLSAAEVPREQVDCGIVVVTYNSARHVERLLQSIPEAADGLRVRCVVVDNNSQDDTVSVVRARSDVELVEAGGNYGYSGGINIGRSRVGPCSSLLILNPDLELVPGAIAQLYQSLSEPGVGVTVPMLRGRDGSLYFSLRREPSLSGALGEALFGDHWASRPDWLSETIRDERVYQQPCDVGWAGGAALMISAACDSAVGEWDYTRFFLYSEEIDFATRARRCGFRIRYVPTACAHHEAGGSGKSVALMALQSVNKVRYYEKHSNHFSAVLFRGIIALQHLLRSSRDTDRKILSAVLQRSSWAQLPHGDTLASRAQADAEEKIGI